MMSKATIAALALILGTASASLAIEPLPPVGVRREVIVTPNANLNPNAYPVQGVRFVGQSYMVRTGNLDGGDGAYNGCPEPCPNCDRSGVCVDWTLMPWFGTWHEPNVRKCYRPGRNGGYYTGF